MRASSMQPEKLVRQLVSESACGVLVCSDENAIQKPDPLEFGTPHEGAVARALLVVRRRAGSTHGRHVCFVSMLSKSSIFAVSPRRRSGNRPKHS